MKLTLATITGVGRWEFTILLPVGSGPTAAEWFASVPEEPPWRWWQIGQQGFLARTEDRAGVRCYVLRKPLRPVGERFYIDVVGDILRIDQAMMAWWKAYVLVFTFIMYAAGVGGLIAAVVAEDLGSLPLLAFPIFLRLVVLPMTRLRDRDAFRSLIAYQLLAAAWPRSSEGSLQQ